MTSDREPLTDEDRAALIARLETAGAGFDSWSELDHDSVLTNSDAAQHGRLLREAAAALRAGRSPVPREPTAMEPCPHNRMTNLVCDNCGTDCRPLIAPDVEPEPLTKAATDILAERARQVSQEGWTPAHDDEHADGALALAASAYAMPNAMDGYAPRQWPWSMAWWKPKDRRRNLVKAGALILAEIERLDRAAPAKEGPAMEPRFATTISDCVAHWPSTDGSPAAQPADGADAHETAGGL